MEKQQIYDTLTEIGDLDKYTRLRFAILKQAVTDYKRLLYLDSLSMLTYAQELEYVKIQDVRTFFTSSWFELLVGDYKEEFLHLLDLEVKEYGEK